MPKSLKHESATCIFITNMIEIKLDYKNWRGKKDFIKFPSKLSSTSCVFYQHGSEYIRKVSLLGTSPNTLFLGMGIRLLMQPFCWLLSFLYLNTKSPHLE